MKNINRDYLVKVDARTAKITPPKDMKFFMTDVLTSNIFFQLENLINSNIWDPRSENSEFPEDADNYVPKESADLYELTLRVVKPNNEPKTIKAERLDQSTNFFIADLTADFVDIPGFYECELFIDTNINERQERSTTEPFEYEVKKSIFYNLDDIVDSKYLTVEDIATIDYVNSLAVGGVSLDGYATTEQLNTKADEEHVHDEYITQTVLDEAIAGIDCANINLTDFVVSNSISIDRKEYSVIGQYSTAEGHEITASGYASHAEGYFTIASGGISHAEGSSTTASNDYSHAEGLLSTASGEGSHAEGYRTVASGIYSHAEGFQTIAGPYQHAQGKYNIENKNDYAHIVGNGTSDARSNAHTLDWNGNAWYQGDVFVGGTSQYFNSKKLATEEYVDSNIKIYGDSWLDHTHDEYVTQAEFDKAALEGGAYDDTELRSLIDNKSDKDHTHDEYITQTELDEAAYDDTELRGLINNKADKDHTHTDVLVDVYASDNILTLTTDKYQLANNLSGEITIVLPTVENFTEIHLFFTPTVDSALVLPNIKYQNMPTTEIGKTYEYIFTYAGIWLAGVITYG